MRPLVTIGMPVYNCAGTVAESIASILNQSFQDWELVIYDDGSRDDTVEVVRKFRDPRIRLIVGSENLQLPTRLNQIVAQCESEYFARMDGDDVSYPRRLELQLRALRKHPEIDLLGGSTLIINNAGTAIGFRGACETHREICGRPWRLANLAHMTWMGRATWFRAHPYNPKLTHMQDRALLLSARRDSNFAALRETLVGVREDRPVWRKLVRARAQMIRFSVEEGLRQRDPGLMLVTPLVEIAKFALDKVATATGVGHRLLRYRIPPYSATQAAEWREVQERTQARAFEEMGQQIATLV